MQTDRKKQDFHQISAELLKEDLKKKNDSVHVPEALLNETIQKMQEKNDCLHQRGTIALEETPSRVLRWYQRPAARVVSIAACMCLLLTAVLAWSLPANVPMAVLAEELYPMYRPSGLPELDTTQKDMDLSAYTAYTQLDYSALFPKYTIVASEAEVLYDTQDMPVSEHALIHFQKGTHEIQLTVTTEELPAMYNLRSAEAVPVDSIRIHFGRAENEERYFAVWEYNGRNFYFQSETLSRRAFVLAVKDAAEACSGSR